MMGANIVSKESSEFFKKVIHQSLEGGDRIRQREGKGANKYITLVEQLYENTNVPGSEKSPEEAGKPKKLTYNEFIGMNVLQLSVGNEATTTILTCTAYQLALSPEVQDKIIEEIDRNAPNPEDINYDTMSKMKYMEMVIYECFRLYPPVVSTDRECAETVTYGKYTLPKGLVVHIPAYSVQHDEDLWPNPEEFRPERFSPENKDSVEPLAWLPFGGGPRACVAVKLILLLMKVFLTRVLQEYRFEACPETPVSWQGLGWDDIYTCVPKTGVIGSRVSPGEEGELGPCLLPRRDKTTFGRNKGRFCQKVLKCASLKLLIY
ncbi:cytochrome P450 3A19-like [Acanthaster planci]|uniref:Cytochrome P450 3A19-like n=1 Tax=Acanthaster planci TaxID=133434 RepID=A0A8B8A2I7_ACAPL|nr:cytochrome P450 3A19-like [Acanthaster planci]